MTNTTRNRSKRWLKLEAPAFVPVTLLTVGLAVWAWLFTQHYSGGAVTAFGPVEPLVDAWRRLTYLYLAVGGALGVGWVWAVRRAWRGSSLRGWGDRVGKLRAKSRALTRQSDGTKRTGRERALGG